jgi:hypothetical protein
MSWKEIQATPRLGAVNPLGLPQGSIAWGRGSFGGGGNTLKSPRCLTCYHSKILTWFPSHMLMCMSSFGKLVCVYLCVLACTYSMFTVCAYMLKWMNTYMEDPGEDSTGQDLARGGHGHTEDWAFYLNISRIWIYFQNDLLRKKVCSFDEIIMVKIWYSCKTSPVTKCHQYKMSPHKMSP